uniref:EXPERA domain-containing protein n=1 Tax=Cannabis sativa TaxID=3483 RepID=A0A803QJW5_CANSA
MGVLVKVTDAILFVFFVIIALAAPLIDAQTCLPTSLIPDFLVELTSWYSREFGDYLVAERPHFYVGLLWLEFLFQWPLALINLYGILSAKSWFNTTCLIYGVSASTALAAILSEMIGSNKASDKLIMLHLPFLGFGVLATLRGLLPQSGKASPTVGKGPALARKKRA